MRVLAISSGYGLFKPSSGGRSRFYHIVKQLANKGCKVWVLQPAMFKDQRDASVARTYYFRNNVGCRTFTMLGDLNPHFLVKLSKIIKTVRPRIIQISSPFGIVAAKFMSKTLFSGSSLVIYDAHNVESSMYALGPKNLLEKSFVSRYVLCQEKLAVDCADSILATSNEDRRIFLSKFRAKTEKITIVPSGAEINVAGFPKQSRTENKKHLNVVFHGSFFHPPNREAVESIKNYIAPRVKQIADGVTFLLAGADMPIFEIDNIVSLGFVKNIYAFLADANLAIVPIKSGGGTRLKIMDYMAMGLPIVTTKKGIEGIEAVNGVHAIIVDDVDESFIEAIMKLIRSKTLRKKLGANAKKLVKEKYNWNLIGAQLYRLYAQISERRK